MVWSDEEIQVLFGLVEKAELGELSALVNVVQAFAELRVKDESERIALIINKEKENKGGIAK